tara:strand:+ start:3357 stop:3899 length:543 start_codon:yes stop_codon:yes gene_type:complete
MGARENLVNRASGRNPKKIKNGGNGTNVGNALRFLVAKGTVIAPAILNLAGAITGREDLHRLSDLISGDKSIAQEDKDILLAEISADLAQEVERTKRWEADLNSDSWLSKNARPIALFNMLFMFDVIMIAALFDRELMNELVPLAIPNGYVTLFMSAFLTVLNGYFVLRTVEKRNKNKYN